VAVSAAYPGGVVVDRLYAEDMLRYRGRSADSVLIRATVRICHE
jgi:hypothetical protein